ncbi:MAG: hypothetical protein WDN75_05485 [Bacteroidota bacterium]
MKEAVKEVVEQKTQEVAKQILEGKKPEDVVKNLLNPTKTADTAKNTTADTTKPKAADPLNQLNQLKNC